MRSGIWRSSIWSRISARIRFLCIFPLCSQCSLWCHTLRTWAARRSIPVGDSPPRAPRKDRRRRAASELGSWFRCSRDSLFEVMKVGLIQFGPAFQPGSISSVFFLRVLRLSVVPFFFGLAWAECRLILVGDSPPSTPRAPRKYKRRTHSFGVYTLGYAVRGILCLRR